MPGRKNKIKQNKKVIKEKKGKRKKSKDKNK